jgi:serine/threonine-protein kinase RsbT
MKVSINSEADVIVARMEARQMAKQMGFGTVDQARISLAASELARLACDTVSHSGEIVMSNANQEGQEGMQVICSVGMTAESSLDDNSSAILSEQMKFRRGLASVSRLVDESVLELGDDGQASVTLIKWFNF